MPDLVAGRKVLLRRGKAYISSSDLASLVVGTFRQAQGGSLWHVGCCTVLAENLSGE